MQGMGSQKYTDEVLEKTLLGDGVPLRDYFIVDGRISYWTMEGAQAICFYEGVEFETACIEYLRSHGVPEYRTSEEAEAARNAHG
jgi:hypothetical protein